MAATTLPIVASAAPSTAAATTRGSAPVTANQNANSAGSQSNGEAAPNDFLAMFAQMITTTEGAKDATASEQSGDKTAEKPGEKADGTDPTDIASLLQPLVAAIQLPVQTTQTTQLAQSPQSAQQILAATQSSAAPQSQQPTPPAGKKTDLTELTDAQVAANSDLQKAVGNLLPDPDARADKASDNSDSTQSGSPTPAVDATALSAANNVAKTQATPTVQIHAPVGSKHWPDQIGAQLTMMAQKGEHTASLKLSPEHLGPVEVRIAVRDDQTTVWFGAQHADTRAAIEQALPRLRELFAAQGMSLGDSGVYREAPRDTPKHFSSAQGTDRSSDSVSVTAVAAVRAGLVDTYA